ncbi:hypothetical protein [Flexithrix dorotheae]|uniref:hypothetical protein n=1 Tax=Flexithrix dorotheae TaxID=70993 RepID=UPI00035E83DC|nr:hypothetical protein [Flexithrix dorotheae]
MAYQIQAYDKAYEYLAHIHHYQPLKGTYLLYLQLLMHEGYPQKTGINISTEVEMLSENSLIAAPKDALDHLVNAQVLSIYKRYSEATAAFIKVAKLGYKPAVNYAQAFHHAFDAKEFEKVIVLYEKLKTHAPRLFDDVYGARWAFSLFKLERYEEAIKAYKEILFDYPVIAEDNDSYVKWSSVIHSSYIKEGYIEDAIKYLSIKCSKKREVAHHDLRVFEDMAAKQTPYNELSHLGTLQIMKYSDTALTEEDQNKLNHLRNKVQEEVFYKHETTGIKNLN